MIWDVWFLFTDQTDFISDQLYPLQKVDLNCIQPDFAKGQIKWTLDNKDLALDNTNTYFQTATELSLWKVLVKVTVVSDMDLFSLFVY